MQIKTTRQALQAMAILAATKDVRHYLLGVCLQTGPDGTYLAACDGRVLGALRLSDEKLSESCTILPTQDLAGLPKKGPDPVTITVPDATDKPIEIEYAGGSLLFKGIIGKFPDWRGMLPTEYDGVVAQFDHRLIARLAKVAQILSGRVPSQSPVPYIRHSGADGGVVTFRGLPEFLGALAPYYEGAFDCAWHPVALEEQTKPEMAAQGRAPNTNELA